MTTRLVRRGHRINVETGRNTRDEFARLHQRLDNFRGSDVEVLAATLPYTGGTGIVVSTNVIDLDDTTVTPGVYTAATIDVDQQGRIISASSTPVLTGSGTDDFLPLWATGGFTNSALSQDMTRVYSSLPSHQIKFDVSNYATWSTDSAGLVTFNAVGSAPGFVFDKRFKVTNDTTSSTFEVRRASGGGVLGLGVDIASTGAVSLFSTTSTTNTNGFIVRPSSSRTASTPIFDVQTDLGTSRFSVAYDGSVLVPQTLGVTGVATFTARDVHNGGITNLSTTALQLNTGYDSTRTCEWDTSSTGAHTLTLKFTGTAGNLLTLAPSGSALGTNAPVFKVHDLSARPRFYVGRTELAGAGNHCVRMGFNAVIGGDYIQIYGGGAAGADTTISMVASTGTPKLVFSHISSIPSSIRFDPPLTLNNVIAAAFTTVAPTSNIGFTFTGVAPTSSIGFVYSTTAPTFNDVSPTFATTANGVFQGFEWPVSNPLTAGKIRVGVRGALFTPTLDNIYNVAYNINPVSSDRDDTSEHAFAKQTEFDFYDSVDHSVEDMYAYRPPSGAETGVDDWRPYFWSLNTTTGRATCAWMPNNDDSGVNRYLEFIYPHVAFNRDTTTGNYTGAALSAFWYGRRHGSSGGTTFAAFNSELFFNQTVSYTGDKTAGNTVRLDFSEAGVTTGYVLAYHIPTPVAPGAGSTVQGLLGFYVEDLRPDLISASAYDQVFRAEIQTTGGDGSIGNHVMIGTGFDEGHYVVGTWHIWDSSTGTLRAKSSAPTSDGDGDLIPRVPSLTAFTQTYSTASHTHPTMVAAALATTAATQTTPWGFASQAQADDIATQFNLLRTDVDNLKQLVNAVIDDGQLSSIFA